MTAGTVNLGVVRNFLNLPAARQKEIQKGGEGVYCLLVLGPLTQYSRDEYPELYERRRPILRERGRQYIVFNNLPLDPYQILSNLPGSVWIPFKSHGRMIEEILS